MFRDESDHYTEDGKIIRIGMKIFWKSECPMSSTDGIEVSSFYHGDPLFMDGKEELWVPLDFVLFSTKQALEDFYKQ